jgi:hypothetical protein
LDDEHQGANAKGNGVAPIPAQVLFKEFVVARVEEPPLFRWHEATERFER